MENRACGGHVFTLDGVDAACRLFQCSEIRRRSRASTTISSARNTMDLQSYLNGDETTTAPEDRAGDDVVCYANDDDDDERDSSAKCTTRTSPTFDDGDDDDNDDDVCDRGVFGECKSQSQPSYFGSTPPSQFFRKSESAVEDSAGDLQNESKVLVIYTGGTIGMIRNDENSKWRRNYLIAFRRSKC